MDVPLWVWGSTIAGILALLIFDFFAHVRTTHEPSLREAAGWSVFYVVVALIFGGGLWLVSGGQYGVEYFAGYVTEKSLSVDNLFVFVIIMAAFDVPKANQQKVLLVGVVIALVLRAIFIALGAVAIEHFSWVFYIFGAFLGDRGVGPGRPQQALDPAPHPARARNSSPTSWCGWPKSISRPPTNTMVPSSPRWKTASA